MIRRELRSSGEIFETVRQRKAVVKIAKYLNAKQVGRVHPTSERTSMLSNMAIRTMGDYEMRNYQYLSSGCLFVR